MNIDQTLDHPWLKSEVKSTHNLSDRVHDNLIRVMSHVSHDE